MKIKTIKNIILTSFGLILFITGILLAILISEPQGIMKTFPFICVGVGSGIFGGSLSLVIVNRILQKNPQLSKQKNIDIKDERNIIISNKAKAKAFDFTLIIFSVLLITFALFQVKLFIILGIVAAYLFVISVFIYYLSKYHKSM